MIKSFKLKALVSIACVGFLMVGFQNCSSQISQEDMSTQAINEGLSENSGLNSELLPDNTDTVIDQPSNTLPVVINQPPTEEVTPPVGSQPEQQMPPVATQPTPQAPLNPTSPKDEESEDEECIKWALEKETDEVKAACTKKHNKKSSKAKLDEPDKKSQKAFAKERCYVKPEHDQDDIDYQALCSLKPKTVKFLNNLGKFMHVFKIRGFSILTPQTIGKSSLESLEDARGFTLVCGLQIDRIHDTRGKLVLVDSRVGEISHHRGKTVLLNTQAENCSDIKGRIHLIGDKAVCGKISDSIGVVKVNRGN